MLGWIEAGLRESDKDRHTKREARERSIKTEMQALKTRLERLYVDKVEAEISAEFYRETRGKWEGRITELQLELAALDRAEPTSVDEAMRILELASSAHLRFKNADSEQKRQLLQFILSNSIWADGKLHVELLELFDLMLNLLETKSTETGGSTQNSLAKVKSVDWWRIGDSNP